MVFFGGFWLVLHALLGEAFKEDRGGVAGQQFFISAKIPVSPIIIFSLEFSKSTQMISLAFLWINRLRFF